MSGDSTGIVMYSSAFCGYCAAAKRLLRRKGVLFTEIDVLFHRKRREEMIALSGRQTVPQIFIGGKHIGGFDDLHALETRGELDAIVATVKHDEIHD